MDSAVLEAYGWRDMAHNNYSAMKNSHKEMSGRLYDNYEVDYLPENKRVRYHPPDARKELLKLLLAVNHKIHTEEVATEL